MDTEDPSTTETGEVSVEPASPPPGWVLTVVNPVLRWLLRSPLSGLVDDHLLLLSVTGRRSGREYTFPVGYESSDGTVTITSHGTTWWTNLRDGGQTVTLWIGGERRTGHATVEEGDRAVAEHVHGYLERNGPSAARRVGLDVEGDRVPSVGALERVVDHVVVVTVDLDAD